MIVCILILPMRLHVQIFFFWLHVKIFLVYRGQSLFLIRYYHNSAERSVAVWFTHELSSWHDTQILWEGKSRNEEEVEMGWGKPLDVNLLFLIFQLFVGDCVAVVECRSLCHSSTSYLICFQNTIFINTQLLGSNLQNQSFWYVMKCELMS